MSRREETKFVARLPDDLHQEIKETALKNNRSMNGEIIHRLRQQVFSNVHQVTLSLDSKDASVALERMLEELKATQADGLFEPLRG